MGERFRQPLTEREFIVLAARWPAGPDRSDVKPLKTHKSLSEQFAVCKERIRQIEVIARRKVRWQNLQHGKKESDG